MTFIADLFPKLRTPKNVVIYLSKMSRLKGPFDRQHGKRIQTLLRSEPQHRFSTNQYSLLKRDNLTQPIRMQLSENEKLFLNFLLYFRNLH